MTTARDIMTPDVVCVRTSDTVYEAAKLMSDKAVGSLPICGEDNRLKGMLTDRDIVVKVIAAGKEARAVHAGELAEGRPLMVRSDDDVAEVLRLMKQHQVRRVPVLEGDELVGIVAQADAARSLNSPEFGALVEEVSRD